MPPLEVQREIVAEIEGYQRVIDGARAVIDNYRPQIAVDPGWPMVEIGQIAAQQKHSIKAGPFGSALKKESYVPAGYKIYGQEQVIRGDTAYGDYYINEEKYLELESCKVQAGDVLISLVGTYGKTLIVSHDHEPGIINPRLISTLYEFGQVSACNRPIASSPADRPEGFLPTRYRALMLKNTRPPTGAAVPLPKRR